MSVDQYPAFSGSMRKSAVPVVKDGGANAARNRAALRQMSELEVLCGMTAEQWTEFHAAQRARVRARWAA